MKAYNNAHLSHFTSVGCMPDSHKFVYYHWILGYINHARAEKVCVGIRYSLFQKQEENHLHQQ